MPRLVVIDIYSHHHRLPINSIRKESFSSHVSVSTSNSTNPSYVFSSGSSVSTEASHSEEKKKSVRFSKVVVVNDPSLICLIDPKNRGDTKRVVDRYYGHSDGKRHL
ncbi:hypothetical protein PHYBLDRAFT_65361 [Phycomyces blakesleeanus NRRL 1555(-)]|uniref:Uncharacterized protein n=1 Tax=Phycomyces blakesleeanus (strain ATCC 8743b / DSM 1359 / FGSC 10004 / NBRC 33097 / NRRL 1555) TaxID=763407 RepID=A0A167MFL6_PHYB8|nr:hypothetical protein PHYBLDRAFT_65361 [Phycomyces blakesleeanus NRRL 1555(-)]OAD72719.1 hypothetical protein PHYBLDRAFT_65361 [Phycomyces blakesleeanus NRRL 1555(-)]|eukprot:XP_018290759.1 hypothetical protein PHYBLDRAFT_65361 [Phycomyces blakesleeanus NRRL 1555(-)]